MRRDMAVSKKNTSMTEAAKAKILERPGVNADQLDKVAAAVSVGLWKLKVAFFANRNDRESDKVKADGTLAVWLEAFYSKRPEVILEAVSRFIREDRSGFFPAPGLIMGFVEQIEREEKARESFRREVEQRRRLLEKMNAESARIDRGE